MNTDVSSRKKAEDFFKDLEERGIVHSVTNKENLISALTLGKKAYLGIDPTASSLHLGHYFGLTLLRRFLKSDYEVVLLIGGATALIGDPSFRNKERPVLSPEEIKKNIDSLIGEIKYFFKAKDIYAEGTESKNNIKEKWINLTSIARELQPFFEESPDFEESDLTEALRVLSASSNVDNFCSPEENNSRPSHPLLIVNNIKYYEDLSAIDLIKDVCKHINVNDLLHKDFLKDRLASSGLTGSEFLYPVCQAWDFYKLCQEEDVYIQLGGSDQWGNIVAGLSFLKKKSFFEDNQSREDEVSGLTFPLLSDCNGKKFGKSEGNALFLNSEKTNPMDVYQYLRRLDPDTAAKYLLMLTEVKVEEVEAWKGFDPKNADLQKKLAFYVCEDIYGSEIAQDLETKCEFLYSSEENLDLGNKELFGNWTYTYPFNSEGIPIIQVLTDLKLAKSNADATRLIKGRGIKIEGQRIEDINYLIKKLDNQDYIRVQKGKKERRIIYFE